MNKLDPSLKRLMKWSRSAAVSAPEETPFGFPGRVLASATHGQPSTFIQELQQRALGIACASLVLLTCGTLVLLSQRTSPPPEPEISSALNFAANNLLQ